MLSKCTVLTIDQRLKVTEIGNFNGIRKIAVRASQSENQTTHPINHKQKHRLFVIYWFYLYYILHLMRHVCRRQSTKTRCSRLVKSANASQITETNPNMYGRLTVTLT